MKKKITVLITLVILFIGCFPLVSFAEGENQYAGNENMYSEYFYMPPVVDRAGFLSESELEDVSEALDKVREKYGIDVALYTESYMSGSSAMKTADDWYDYNYYGYGDDSRGILLYVSENPREYWFSTCGVGINVFNDEALDYLKEEVVSYMSDDDYYSAFLGYADSVDSVLAQVIETGKPYEKKKNFVMIIGLAIIIGLIIGFIVALIMTNKRKKEMLTAMRQADADEYVKKNSLNLEIARDIYLYSNVIATKRPESNSSGTHMSSSGMSHGGGGGRY